MNFKRFLAVALLITSLLPSTDVLNAMWCCRARRAPAAAVAPVPIVNHVHVGGAPVVVHAPDRRYSLVGCLKDVAKVVVGAGIMWLVMRSQHAQPVMAGLPTTCKFVVQPDGHLLTCNSLLATTCMKDWINATDNYKLVLDQRTEALKTCEIMIQRTKTTCERALGDLPKENDKLRNENAELKLKQESSVCVPLPTWW